MVGKVLIKVDARHEQMVRRALALAEEMEQLALSAPQGAVRCLQGSYRGQRGGSSKRSCGKTR